MPPSLSFIKLGQPGDPPASGTVEVHWDTLKDGAYKRVGDYTSDFSPNDAANGTWQLLFDTQNNASRLGFIKLRNVGNPGGMVEVHLDTLVDGTYKRVGDYVSDFSVKDADNGVWQLIDNGEVVPPVLAFIKLKNVGNPAGMVEIHVDMLQGETYKRVGDFVSDFSVEDAENGVWQIPYAGPNQVYGGSPSTYLLSFIKLRSPGKPVGMVEVQSGNFVQDQNGVWSSQPQVSFASDFSQNDAANGTWRIFFSPNDGMPLGFIKLRNVGNAAGMVEFHFDTAQQGGAYKRAGDYVSDFSLADADNGVWGCFE